MGDEDVRAVVSTVLVEGTTVEVVYVRAVDVHDHEVQVDLHLDDAVELAKEILAAAGAER